MRQRIVGHVRGANQACTLLHTQHNMAAQQQRAGGVIAGRNHRFSAAQGRTAVDGLLDGKRVFCFTVSGRAQIANIQGNPGTGLRGCGRVRRGRVRRRRLGLLREAVERSQHGRSQSALRRLLKKISACD